MNMDHSYAQSKLTQLLRDIDHYSGEEFWRQMSRIAAGSTGANHAEGLMTERDALKKECKLLAEIVQDLVVANQSAWIEWQYGRGADAAMAWIHNGLLGPGHIPDEDAAYGKDPQAWFDANKANPFPKCYCGRPSNRLWMGHGACCDEHMLEIQRRQVQEATE